MIDPHGNQQEPLFPTSNEERIALQETLLDLLAGVQTAKEKLRAATAAARGEIAAIQKRAEKLEEFVAAEQTTPQMNDGGHHDRERERPRNQAASRQAAGRGTVSPHQRTLSGDALPNRRQGTPAKEQGQGDTDKHAQPAGREASMTDREFRAHLNGMNDFELWHKLQIMWRETSRRVVQRAVRFQREQQPPRQSGVAEKKSKARRSRQ